MFYLEKSFPKIKSIEGIFFLIISRAFQFELIHDIDNNDENISLQNKINK